jgi:hypothetical protein
LRRFARWQVTSEQRNAKQQERNAGEGQRIGRADSEKERPHQPCQQQCAGHPDPNAAKGQDHALPDDQFQLESTDKKWMKSISLNIHRLFRDFWRFSLFTK